MEIEGSVKLIVFRNAQNGFTVLRLNVPKNKILTATGFFQEIAEGDCLKIFGEWVEHPRFGRQIQVEASEKIEENGNDFLLRYFLLMRFPGVGQKTAESLIKKFGGELCSLIEKEPKLLCGAVRGFTESRVKKLVAAWEAEKESRESIFFLLRLGLENHIVWAIWKGFQAEAEEKIRENPYALCSHFGVSFSFADGVARRLGFSKDSPRRATAAIFQALSDSSREGHLYLPSEKLIIKVFSLLGISPTDDDTLFVIEEEMRRLTESGELIFDFDGFWLPNFWNAENDVAEFIAERTKRIFFKSDTRLNLETLPSNAIKPFVPSKNFPPLEKISPSKKNVDSLSLKFLTELEKFEKEEGIQFDSLQKEGILLSMKNRFTVITGGPGTGKTTMLRGILRLSALKKEKVVLSAPTGRAAKRMKEVCGNDAMTIHRLLLLDSHADFFIVDEFSMVDIELCQAFFSAASAGSRVLLLGDSDQLPSVGPGNVLKEILSSEVFSVRLEKIFRQQGENDIAKYAREINLGRMPSPLSGRNFHYVQYESEEEGWNSLCDLIQRVIPSVMKLDLARDLQVLVPMRGGFFGTKNLNKRLQNLLNKKSGRGASLILGGTEYRVGDRIMQLENNYERNIFNGDLGFIVEVMPSKNCFLADFDGRVLKFGEGDAEEISLAYASTIHKAQGSESPAVLVILDASHSRMLRRNLLYTAVTRAKGHVWVLAYPGAFSSAVRNRDDFFRYTKLCERIENFKTREV